MSVVKWVVTDMKKIWKNINHEKTSKKT